jgi:vacuolar-type H+-ATPase subunit F/Vma7
MSLAAVIGEATAIQGYALAGALVCPAVDQDEALAAWHSLPSDVAVVVLTAKAASWLSEAVAQRRGILPVVMRS